ncbi:MAG: chromate transporter [Clostridia bacterium]|nr:chromate transporter [Clostridia bacterium]
MIYLELLLGFLKVGFFAFGGAYAAIPFIREVVLAYNWLSDEMLSYIIAVSESTPGPVMVNMATYVGASQKGLLGSAIATLAVVLPAFVIILLVMVVFRSLLKNRYFRAVIGGLQAAIIGIIAATGVYMIYKNIFLSGGGFNTDFVTLAFTACIAIIYFPAKKLLKKNVSPILVISVCAVAGVFVFGF